jgi:Flp pilus assembly protein TadG
MQGRIARVRWPAFWRDDEGATALEFALVAPCVIILILSIIEIGVIALMSASLDTAVIAAGRTVRTGLATGPATATAFKASICGLMPASLGDCEDKLTISVQKYASFADVSTAAAALPAGQFDRGQAGDIMLVKASYRWPLLTPFLGALYQQAGPTQILLQSRLTFRNEPYT